MRNDIVGLAELHTNEEISLEGFTLLKKKFRVETHKGPKISGGIAVFVKNHLQDMVQYVPSENEDSIWVKVKGNTFGEHGDAYIGTFYVSPLHQRNKDKVDIFSKLDAEISLFKDKGSIFIQGDLNARIGIEHDSIKHDKFDELFGIENSNNQLMRNSEDLIVNTRGNELLDFCKTHDFLIVNGRKVGDLFGNYTSHQWNGSRVVDYLITSSSHFDNIFNFSIGEFIPWLSDHCPLYTKIVINGDKPNEKEQNKNLKYKEPGFRWQTNYNDRFEANLHSNFIKTKVNQLLNSELEPTDLAKELRDILIYTASKCKLKKNGRTRTGFPHLGSTKTVSMQNKQ